MAAAMAKVIFSAHSGGVVVLHQHVWPRDKKQEQKRKRERERIRSEGQQEIRNVNRHTDNIVSFVCQDRVDSLLTWLQSDHVGGHQYVLGHGTHKRGHLSCA
jgi:hypothetical protein